jgi:hypothetical protein
MNMVSHYKTRRLIVNNLKQFSTNDWEPPTNNWITIYSFTMKQDPALKGVGYPRDHRGNCRQIFIGLVVTHDEFPMGYKIFVRETESKYALAFILCEFRRYPLFQRKIFYPYR